MIGTPSRTDAERGSTAPRVRRPMRSRPRRPLVAALLTLALTLAGCVGDNEASPAPDTPVAQDPSDVAERHLDVDVVAIECPIGYDNQRADDVCLAYNGQVPGPTWVFEAGERVTITLHHRVAETLDALGAEGAEHLAEARYSLHRHGVSLEACSDGVAQPTGTAICDSTVGPGGSITYTMDALFPGSWHYHDHAHTFSAHAERGPLLGHEGVERGLWGSMLVLPPGGSTGRVFDLHLTDAGPNGGMGLDGAAREGERFDLNVVGLGRLHRFFDVRLEDPDGGTVGEVLVGPGVSRAITVQDARPGTYTWTAEGLTVLAPAGPLAALPRDPGTFTGTIVVGEGVPPLRDGPPTPTRGPGPNNTYGLSAPSTLADRVFIITFNRDTSTQLVAQGEPMGLPLLEANVGELLEFHVVNSDSAPHVFHLHGHPWVDPDTGELIDAAPLVPGRQDTHAFQVVAGLEAGHAGDWLYHCHVGYDATMWGVLRVHA